MYAKPPTVCCEEEYEDVSPACILQLAPGSSYALTSSSNQPE